MVELSLDIVNSESRYRKPWFFAEEKPIPPPSYLSSIEVTNDHIGFPTGQRGEDLPTQIESTNQLKSSQSWDQGVFIFFYMSSSQEAHEGTSVFTTFFLFSRHQVLMTKKHRTNLPCQGSKSIADESIDDSQRLHLSVCFFVDATN